MKNTIIIIFSILFIILQTIYNLGGNNDVRLGADYYYCKYRKDILCNNNKDGSVDIPPTVLSYAFDRNYILVKQKMDTSIDVIYDKIVYPHSVDSIYYWVINKKIPKVYGPINKNEFDEILNDNNIKLRLP